MHIYLSGLPVQQGGRIPVFERCERQTHESIFLIRLEVNEKNAALKLNE